MRSVRLPILASQTSPGRRTDTLFTRTTMPAEETQSQTETLSSVDELLQKYVQPEPEPEPEELEGDFADSAPRQPTRSFVGASAVPNARWRSFLDSTGTATQATPEVDLPIWGAAGTDGKNCRLRVQRQTLEGMWEELGYLPADAGQYTLVGRYRAAGHYRVTPIDDYGQNMHPQGYIVNIPPDHPYLRAIHQAGQVPNGGGAAAPAPMLNNGLGEILSFVKENNGSVAEAYAKLDRDRSKVNEEAVSVVKMGADHSLQLSRDVVAVAAEAEVKRFEATQKQFEEAMKAEREAADRRAKAEAEVAERHRQLTEQAGTQNKTFMETFLTLHSTMADRERAAAEARRAEDERRREEWAREQMLRLEREREQDRRDREERARREEQERLDRQRREEREFKEALDRNEREAKRQEEHNRAMLALQMEAMKASNPIANLVALAPMVAPLLAAVGLDGKSLVEMAKDAMAGGAQKGVVSEIAETVREGIKTLGVVLAAQSGVDVAEEEEEGAMDDGTVRPAQLPEYPGVAQFPPPGQPQPVMAEHPNIPPQMMNNAAPAVASVPVPVPVPDPVAALPAPVLKKARMAVMALVEDLVAEPDQNQWEMLTMKNLGVAVNEVKQYLLALGNGDAALGIKLAAQYADASPELADAYLAAARNMPTLKMAIGGL